MCAFIGLAVFLGSILLVCGKERRERERKKERRGQRERTLILSFVREAAACTELEAQ